MSDHAQIEAEIIGSGRITIGTRRQYAEQSLQWKNDEGRTEDQHLQRIWNLANDTLALIDYIHALVAERDDANYEMEQLRQLAAQSYDRAEARRTAGLSGNAHQGMGIG